MAAVGTRCASPAICYGSGGRPSCWRPIAPSQSSRMWKEAPADTLSNLSSEEKARRYPHSPRGHTEYRSAYYNNTEPGCYCACWTSWRTYSDNVRLQVAHLAPTEPLQHPKGDLTLYALFTAVAWPGTRRREDYSFCAVCAFRILFRYPSWCSKCALRPACGCDHLPRPASSCSPVPLVPL